MTEAVNRRGVLSRIGICALNLLLPGLGLIRLARYRLAAAFVLLPFASAAIALGSYFLIDRMSFGKWAVLICTLLAIMLAAYVGSIAATWRASKTPEPRTGFVWRWYGVLAIWVSYVLVSWPLPDIAHTRFRGFYIPARSMLPTMQVDDRYLADMHDIGPIARGDTVIVHANGIDYVKRVAGLPGDRIALVNGIVVLNGEPIAQQFVEKVPFQEDLGVQEATVFRERFPGETKPHLIMDTGQGMLDNAPEIALPSGSYFMLGDNRDHSADSRLPPGFDSGLGLVAGDAITGRVAFRYWRDGYGIGPGGS
jgi:signal peptidase I